MITPVSHLPAYALGGAFDNHCEGVLSAGGGPHVLGLYYAAASTPVAHTHVGSQILDQIVAFDKAELAEAHLAQINLIPVSSFCGPEGRIWGHDLAHTPQHTHPYGLHLPGHPGLPVFSAQPLRSALRALFGPGGQPKFPPRPGTMLPCAAKYKFLNGPGIVYATIGLAIAKDRQQHACLLMEDVGSFDPNTHAPDVAGPQILQTMADSIATVAGLQRMEIDQVYVDWAYCHVPEGHIGCGLVAAPYFRLARNAMPPIDALHQWSLDEWQMWQSKHKGSR